MVGETRNNLARGPPTAVGAGRTCAATCLAVAAVTSCGQLGIARPDRGSRMNVTGIEIGEGAHTARLLRGQPEAMRVLNADFDGPTLILIRAIERIGRDNDGVAD